MLSRKQRLLGDVLTECSQRIQMGGHGYQLHDCVRHCLAEDR
jgi:hypothetical protein